MIIYFHSNMDNVSLSKKILFIFGVFGSEGLLILTLLNVVLLCVLVFFFLVESPKLTTLSFLSNINKLDKQENKSEMIK